MSTQTARLLKRSLIDASSDDVDAGDDDEDEDFALATDDRFDGRTLDDDVDDDDDDDDDAESDLPSGTSGRSLLSPLPSERQRRTATKAANIDRRLRSILATKPVYTTTLRGFGRPNYSSCII